jgi:hypothetical protein
LAASQGSVWSASGWRHSSNSKPATCCSSTGDESMRWSTPLLQELARRRLAALARDGR